MQSALTVQSGSTDNYKTMQVTARPWQTPPPLPSSGHFFLDHHSSHYFPFPLCLVVFPFLSLFSFILLHCVCRLFFSLFLPFICFFVCLLRRAVAASFIHGISPPSLSLPAGLCLDFFFFESTSILFFRLEARDNIDCLFVLWRLTRDFTCALIPRFRLALTTIAILMWGSV